MTVRYQYGIDASEATSTQQDIGIGSTPALVVEEDVDIRFTVYQTTDHSTVVDVSAATGIEFAVSDGSGGQEFTKTKSGGGVTFGSNSGADGEIDVAIDSSDTSGLDAATSRSYRLTITDDGSGNQTTVAIGTLELTSKDP